MLNLQQGIDFALVFRIAQVVQAVTQIFNSLKIKKVRKQLLLLQKARS
jgi:hypothetical protein